MIHINIRVIFQIGNGADIIIDSAIAREQDTLIPFISVNGIDKAGVTPTIALSLANLPPSLLSEISLIRNNTPVVIEAGYNGDMIQIVSGRIYTIPNVTGTDNEWVWHGEVIPLTEQLDLIDYNKPFSKGTTWNSILNSWFGSANIPYVIAPSLDGEAIPGELSLNCYTFPQLQTFFFRTQKQLVYKGGQIRFFELGDAEPATATLDASQVKPNQYLDFQAGSLATLELAAWVPNVTSAMKLNLTEDTAVIIQESVTDFTGTVTVVQSAFSISTYDMPTHEIIIKSEVG